MTLSPAPISIRAARRNDLDELAKVHARSSRVAFTGLLPEETLARVGSVEWRRGMWSKFLRTPPHGAQTLVAEIGGRLVGFVAVGPSRDQDRDSAAVGEVLLVYVDPDFWGRGVGRALLGEAVERLRCDGYGSATLWTLAAGTKTLRFYELAGWRPEGAKRPLTLGEGSGALEVRYERTLGGKDEAG